MQFSKTSPIVTPRAITIYLPLNHAFALIARLYPHVGAFKVLEKAQGIYKTHGAAGFLIGLICFFLQLSPLQIGVLTFCVTFGFFLLRLFNIFLIPGLEIIPTIYSRLTGYGLFSLIILAVGLWRVGIIGTSIFIVTRLLVEGLTMVIERKTGTNIGIRMGEDPNSAKAGAMYYAPVRDFINAYMIYAKKCGAPLNPDVSNDELREENWIHVWDDFAAKWPQVANRYIKAEEVQSPNDELKNSDHME